MHMQAVIAVCMLMCVVARHRALGACPSNGNTHVLYATTNMGNNIAAFDTTGRYLGYGINASSLPQDYRVDKLRSMVFGPDGHLYVTSARGTYSKIFAIAGNGLFNGTLNHDCTRDFLFGVAELNEKNPFMDHPYGMLFHPLDQSIYVSNQNSVTITKYVKDRSAATALLKNGATLSHSTWHPASVSPAVESGWTLQSPGGTPLPPKDSGLFAAAGNAKYSLSSVRGIALSPLLSRREVEGVTAESDGGAVGAFRYYLVVCDVVANALVVFDSADGSYVFSIPVKSPIQVAFPYFAFDSVAGSSRQAPSPSAVIPGAPYGSAPSHRSEELQLPKDALFVYVTSKDDGLIYRVPFHMGAERHVQPLNEKAPGQSLSGITENSGHGVLYVADRNGKRIAAWTTPVTHGQRRSQSGTLEVVEASEFLGYFHVNLPDQPEFLTLTRVEAQSNIPYCYELTSDGSLRYTALCLAVNLWKGIVAVAAAALLILYARNHIRNLVMEHRAEKLRRASLFHALEDTSDQLALLRKNSGVDVVMNGYGTSEPPGPSSTAGGLTLVAPRME